ncbi:MAG: DapH/DapD/GlmU-related protein [Myxococcota bacterium]|nr:DapH/DapD/GlmU-related protein [Myxococcota bacterium]
MRAWGSQVGDKVFWATLVKVTDRGHIDIGDNVFFGNEVYLSPHVVRKKGEMRILYLKTIKVGANSFIGAGCQMGPGVVIEENSGVPVLSALFLNQRFLRAKNNVSIKVTTSGRS